MHFEEALELQSSCLEALLGRKLTVIKHQLWGLETKHFEESLEQHILRNIWNYKTVVWRPCWEHLTRSTLWRGWRIHIQKCEAIAHVKPAPNLQ